MQGEIEPTPGEIEHRKMNIETKILVGGGGVESMGQIGGWRVGPRVGVGEQGGLSGISSPLSCIPSPPSGMPSPYVVSHPPF